MTKRTPGSVQIIAEAGVNHDGDLDRALELIDIASDCGADAVKFQTFLPKALAAPTAARAPYQQGDRASDTGQLAMLERLALGFDDHHVLVEHCAKRGIAFLSSPFDDRSADFLLHELRLDTVKLGSGELTNAPMLWRIMQSEARLILSTGMATLDEVIVALGVCCLALQEIEPSSIQQCREAFVADQLVDRVTLLHCTTAYPCPPDAVNLRAMTTLAETTRLPVGYSDHTAGIAVSIAAVARGAGIIEKHFTTDRTLPGPDHAASLEPAGFAAMVQAIREVETALGDDRKSPAAAEGENAAVARKALVAARGIRKGERFDRDNLTSKRPADGISPLHFWSMLGRPANRDYAADEAIDDLYDLS
jgi:N-acetylneuraminate synthase